MGRPAGSPGRLPDGWWEPGHHKLWFPHRQILGLPPCPATPNSSVLCSELPKRRAFPHLRVRGGKGGGGPEARTGVSRTEFQASPGAQSVGRTQQEMQVSLQQSQGPSHSARSRRKRPGGQGHDDGHSGSCDPSRAAVTNVTDERDPSEERRPSHGSLKPLSGMIATSHGAQTQMT